MHGLESLYKTLALNRYKASEKYDGVNKLSDNICLSP